MSLDYTKFTVDDLCLKITDGAHFSPSEFKGGRLMASSKDMTDYGWDFSSIKEIPEEDYKKLVKGDCKPLKDDILIIKDGNNYLKHTFVIKKEIDLVILSSIAILRPDKNKIEPLFFQYLLRDPRIRGLMASYVSGAAIPRVVLSDFKKVEVVIPELPTQKKIASILSAYDDLIENNNQRIKLLEEMAAEIYKEWFVRFRFPGYKEATFLDKEGNKVAYGTKGAIPEGWEKKPIKDIVDIISGYAFKSDTFKEEGNYKLVTIKNVQNGFFVTKTTDCIKELPKNIKEDILLRDKDILLSLTGNIGRICLVYGDNYLLNQRVAKLKPKTENLFEYVYLFFRSDFLRMTLENYSNGAAQQNLSPVDMSELKFLTPTDELLEGFSSITKSFFDEIIILLKKNQILQETRDLLLPRLISGKLSVEDLEVEDIEN
ncbi:restriction endonuclease subunit S [Bacteroidota bacterium]